MQPSRPAGQSTLERVLALTRTQVLERTCGPALPAHSKPPAGAEPVAAGAITSTLRIVIYSEQLMPPFSGTKILPKDLPGKTMCTMLAGRVGPRI